MIKYLLLDRDGVLNKKSEEGQYVRSINEFIRVSAAFQLLSYCQAHSIKTFVVTNQQGVARGIMSLQDVHDIHNHMQEDLRKQWLGIDGFYVCPHHKDENCPCRKPQPWLINQILSDYPDIQKDECLLIGDSDTDIQAAARAWIVSYKIPSDALWEHLSVIISLLSQA